MPEDMEIARKAALLTGLTQDTFRRLMQRAHPRSVSRGASVFLQGEAAHSVFVVLDGWVKLFRTAKTGSEAIVGVVTRGDSFGESAALKGEVYSTSAETVTNARLIQFDAPHIWRMIERDPLFGNAIMHSTFEHMNELAEHVELIKVHSGAQRIAEFLLELCDVDEGPCAVTLPYDKVLIAGRLGMKPESLSRAFARLKPIGVAINQNNAMIEAVERLAHFAEQDPAEAWSARR